MGENDVRRYKSTLIYSGMAVVVFAVWGALKLFILDLVDPALIQRFLTQNGMVAGFTLLGFIDLLLRFFIGLSAIGEGKGKKKSGVYLVVGGLYLGVGFAGYVFLVAPYILGAFVWGLAASILIDATSCIAMVLIIRASLGLRKLAKAGVSRECPKASESAQAMR